LIGGALLLIGAVGGAGWWFSASFDPVDRQMAEQRPAWRPADRATPTEEVTEDYLSGAVTLAVTENTEVRDFPSISGGAVLTQQAAGAVVTGRWVRGAEPNSRWLRLSNGGYVYGGVLRAAAPAASETTGGDAMILSINNVGCNWGPDFSRYLDQAVALRDRRHTSGSPYPEDGSILVRVPNRRWQGLTVTGIAVHYEAVTVYFREPVARVRDVLRGMNIEVSDLGEIAIRDEEQAASQSLDPTNGEAAQYGASGITCGV
jgi:hypothetical protein